MSRPAYRLKGLLTWIVFIPMVFNGGLVSTYFIVGNLLGLKNTIWALILPLVVSSFNVIICKTFFKQTVPDSLIESGKIDGAGQFTIFFRIVLPLSAPILAVMVLFYGVGLWNSWFPALLYLRERALYPLQMVLREILIESDISNMAGGTGDVEIIGDGLKYATMIVATLPVMCLYPFLQKYFVKGVMIGAVKG